MNVRTFLILVLGFLVVTAVAVTFLENLPLIEAPFQLTADRSVPVYGVIALAFLLGLSLAVVISLLQDSRSLYERVTMWWSARTRRAVEDRYRQGIEALLGGDDERALGLFTEVLDSKPDHFEALLVSGDVLRGLKRYEEAIERHRQARRIRPRDLRPLYSLASDYEESRQLPQAAMALNKIIELDPKKSVSAFRRLRKIHMKEGEWARALKFQDRIEALIDKTPYKLEAERRYGLGIRYQLALQKAQDGSYREAIGDLRKLLKLSPTFVPAIVRLGEALRESGDSDAAVAVWREGFQATRSAVLLTTLEEHFLEQEDPQVAIDTFRGLIAQAKNDSLPRLFLGRLYLRLEMIDEAYREFRSLERRVPGTPALHAFLGRALARRHDYVGAAAAFERALAQIDLSQLLYTCSVCSGTYPEWRDRCEICGEWNTTTVELEEEGTPEDMGLSASPVYTA